MDHHGRPPHWHDLPVDEVVEIAWAFFEVLQLQTQVNRSQYVESLAIHRDLIKTMAVVVEIAVHGRTFHADELALPPADPIPALREIQRRLDEHRRSHDPKTAQVVREVRQALQQLERAITEDIRKDIAKLFTALTVSVRKLIDLSVQTAVYLDNLDRQAISATSAATQEVIDALAKAAVNQIAVGNSIADPDYPQET